MNLRIYQRCFVSLLLSSLLAFQALAQTSLSTPEQNLIKDISSKDIESYTTVLASEMRGWKAAAPCSRAAKEPPSGSPSR